jgi:hypothetical protein
VLVPVKIFQFQDMLNESERYQDAANGLLESNLKLCNDILALREIVRWNFRTISRIMIFWTRIVYIGYLSFIDQKRGVFGGILPEVMIVTEEL